MTCPSPLVSFTLRVEQRSRLAIHVQVFRTRREFRDASRYEDLADGQRRRAQRTRGLIGQCVGLTVRTKSGRMTPTFAVIRMAKRDLTMSTITHEAFHATLRWAERRKIVAIPTSYPDTDIWKRRLSLEERCATVHDTICRKMVTNLYRFKLLPN